MAKHRKNERRSETLSLRISLHDKATISRGAKLENCSRSEFLVAAALARTEDLERAAALELRSSL